MRVPLRYRVDNAAWRGLSRLPLATRRRVAYLIYVQQLLSLRDPRRFTEKINWRMVADRRPILGEMCDKLRSKQLAVQLVPELRVPRVLWSGSDVADLARVADLPSDWVLKPNHRTAIVHVGHGQPDPDWLRGRTKGWLEDVQWRRHGEWGYSQAQKLIFAEEFLGPVGSQPDDFKVFCFDGQPFMIQHDRDRREQHRRNYLTPEWTMLPVTNRFGAPDPAPRPEQLERLIGVATRLSAGMDFVRVDLYLVGGEIYFGEFTVYPGGGLEGWQPREFDSELGSNWTLPEEAGCSRAV